LNPASTSFVLAYHGCDQQTATTVVAGRAALRPSHNDYDWLGEPRENDLAERYRAGDFDKYQLFEVDEDQTRKYSNRNKTARQGKIEKTSLLRAKLLAAAEVTSSE
jgi:hypothetical protein